MLLLMIKHRLNPVSLLPYINPINLITCRSPPNISLIMLSISDQFYWYLMSTIGFSGDITGIQITAAERESQ